MKTEKQAHIFVSGFVQGVGYRKFIRGKARRLGVSGWVRNLSDGRVEAVVQGSLKEIETLLFYCNKGSYFSRVDQVVVEWEAIREPFQDFRIEK